MLPSLDKLKLRIEEAVAGAEVTILPNEPPNPASLLVSSRTGKEVALFLRDDEELKMDYCSNVTGVDWLERVVKEKVKVKKLVGGVETEVEETIEQKHPGYLEAVYHLFSIKLKHGPLIIRMRTGNRVNDVTLPSLTPVWRGAEFQEREIYDLFGIRFEGHPDLRRLLMWEEFKDHPMRRDYVEPDDYEYEPTPHDDVLAKTRRYYPGLKNES